MPYGDCRRANVASSLYPQTGPERERIEDTLLVTAVDAEGNGIPGGNVAITTEHGHYTGHNVVIMVRGFRAEVDQEFFCDDK